MNGSAAKHPAEKLNASLLEAAELMEWIADTAQNRKSDPSIQEFIATQLPFVEALATHAEQLHAAANRCKHALRQINRSEIVE